MKRFILAIAACAAVSLSSLSPAHADGAGVDTIPEVLIEDLQQELGLKDFQAAAIAGNLAQETGNFTMLHQIRGPGRGYSQWSGSRRTEFQNFADDTLSYEDNRDFLIYELTGPYAKVLTRLKATKTTEQAAQVFMKQFLRPNPRHANLPRRMRFAGAYMAGNFSGAGCIDHVHLGGGRIAECERIVRVGS
ncbi:MAG: phage tail tip lysozyme [Roseibium sp.]|uniref:phage tail tip lysozyme n=1 Tax=Roseibium sp. TaxID=1936156 RepID=UPI00329912E5